MTESEQTNEQTNHCPDCGDGTGERCQPCREAYDRDCERLNAHLEDR